MPFHFSMVLTKDHFYANKYILFDQPFSFTDYSSSLREDLSNPYIKGGDL